MRSSPRRRARPRLHEQLDEAPADAGVDDGLDLVVGAVREIRQSPASVRQQVRVAAEQKPGQHRQAGRHLKAFTLTLTSAQNAGRRLWRYLFKRRRRVFSSAEVGQGPDGVSRHGQSRGFGQKPEQREQPQHRLLLLFTHRVEEKTGVHQQRRKDVAVEHVVSAHCAVACDVT